MTADRTGSLGTSRQSRLAPGLERMADWPWWLIVAILIGLFILLQIVTNERVSNIFGAIIAGIGITIRVTLAAYATALGIGLFTGLARVSSNKFILNLASFYVEVVRGVPILVLLMYIAYVALPLAITGLNALGQWLSANFGLGATLITLSTRNLSDELRVIIGLGVAYGAFESEIFRAGIQSIERGQMEAARALGMSYVQAMRHVILPQAVRRVLPALGNDFIAMLKDSSLVSILGVRDITQITKLYASSTFLFFQSYSLLAFIYLTMTVLLSRLVRTLETRLAADRR